MAHLAEIFSLQEIVLCLGIVVVAAAIQISTGMGFGMLASPLIALVKPEVIPGAILTMGLVVAFTGAWKERSNISLEELKLGVGGRIAGSIMAAGVLLMIPNLEIFLILFGMLSLVAVLLTASGWQLDFNNKNLFRLSVLSGVMGSITAVGAPPMAIIYHNRQPDIVRPTLNAFFGAGSVLGLISLSFTGWLTYDDVVAAVILLPAMAFGIAVGQRFKTMSTTVLSGLLLVLSGVASIMLIIRGFLFSF